MKTTEWKYIVEVAGIAAIVASLMFVGLEMRQTRMLAMAAAYQARTDSEISIALALLETDRTWQRYRKIVAGQDLADQELFEHELVLGTRLMYWENVHYQWENELLTDQFWEANRNSIRAIMLNQYAHQYWKMNRHLWRESFRIEVDKVMDEWEQSQAN